MRQDIRPASAGAALLLTAALPAPSAAETREIPSKKAALVVETLAEGLKQPWSVEVLPDGAYLVSEKGGTLQ